MVGLTHILDYLMLRFEQSIGIADIDVEDVLYFRNFVNRVMLVFELEFIGLEQKRVIAIRKINTL